MPALSILTPVYNGAAALERTAASVFAQRLADFEWIVVDDGSSDGGCERLASLGDRRVRVIRQENAGVTAALNRGLEAVASPVVARLDAGDLCHPDRLPMQLERLRAEPGLVLLGCRVRRVDAEGRPLGLSEVVTGHDALSRGLTRINLFQHSAVAMRREALERAGGYRAFFRFSQDLDLFLRLSETGRVANLAETLSDWVLEPGSVSFRYRSCQARFAEIARFCARERRAGRPDPVEAGLVERPEIRPEPEEARQRAYHLEAARSALMGGQGARARSEAAAARRLGLPPSRLLAIGLASRLPAGALRALRRLRVAWLTRAAS